MGTLDSLYIQSSLDFLSWACKSHPHLRIKIAVDCVEKGYASHHQIADFLGLSYERWKSFYDNYSEGDLQRIPEGLKKVVPPRDLRFFTGFTDEQLDILERVQQVPFLMSEELEKENSLAQELRVLMVFGVILMSKHNQFNSYTLKVSW